MGGCLVSFFLRPVRPYSARQAGLGGGGGGGKSHFILGPRFRVQGLGYRVSFGRFTLPGRLTLPRLLWDPVF